MYKEGKQPVTLEGEHLWRGGGTSRAIVMCLRYKNVIITLEKRVQVVTTPGFYVITIMNWLYLVKVRDNFL